MTQQRIASINRMSFIICLGSICAAVLFGALELWGAVPSSDPLIWRLLGTCGILFAASISSSMAIRCFKTNE